MKTLLVLALIAGSGAAAAQSQAWDPALYGGGSPRGAFPTPAMAAAYGLATEPAVNGQVSRYGLFPSEELAYAHSAPPGLALEPAINGTVSASGLFATQAEEDAFWSGELPRAELWEVYPTVAGHLQPVPPAD